MTAIATAPPPPAAPIEEAPPAFSGVDATSQQLRKTPEAFLGAFKDDPRGRKLGEAALRNANKILDSEDDPRWARPIESKLLYYIQGQAEISTMEVAPIVCRKSGCEIHVLDSFESAMPGPGDEAKGWQAVLQRLIRDEQFRDQFDSPDTSLQAQGDRILYISTLERR